jgi:tetratricopeptide (TPR) repeat protein
MVPFGCIVPVMPCRFLAFALTFLAWLGGPLAVHADQKDPRLVPLFDQLKEAAEPAQAQVVETMIWQIWTEANDPATGSLMQLGLAALQSGNLPGALELFDAVTVGKPDFAEGWNKRATVLYMLGAYEKSAEDVERVLDLEPRHFGALSGLGLINLALDRPEQALDSFEKALKLHPNQPAVKQRVDVLKRKKRDGAI